MPPSEFPAASFLECLLAVKDVEVDGVVGQLHEKRSLASCLFSHKANGFVSDMLHEFGVFFGSRSPVAFAASSTIAGVAIGGIVTLLFRRDVIVAVVPLVKVGSLVARVGRF